MLSTHVLLVPNTLFQLVYGARPHWALPDGGKYHEMWSWCQLRYGGENFSGLDLSKSWHAKSLISNLY